MKKKKFFPVLILAFLGACASQGMVSASALAPVLGPVLDRHDDYVAADTTLNETEKETFSRSSSMVRKTLIEALQSE